MIPAESVLHYVEIILEEWTTFLFCVVVFLVIGKYWWTRPSLPPGPTFVPLLGIVPGLVGDLDPLTMKRYSDAYDSDVISVRYFGRLMVILNSREVIKDTFMIRKDVRDRCGLGWRLLDSSHRGIMTSSGPVWSAANRSMKRLIRDFGYDRGGSRSEALIIEEVEKVRETIIQYDGKDFDPEFVVNGAQCNIMMQLLFNRIVPYDDKEMKECMESLMEIEVAIWGPFDEFILGTWLGRTLYKSHYQRIMNLYKTYVKIAHREVESHVKNFNGQVNDLCDGLISEMQRGKENDVNDFDEAQLKNVMTDLIEASIESNRVQLRWFLLTMAWFPDVQERCYEEMQGVFDKDHVINFDDRARTPYLLATMYELLRHHIEIPFGVYQCSKDRDIKIRGYDVPKGTPVAANYTWLNNDPSTWANPPAFDPNHFLNDGKLIDLDKMASFSIGRRACIGEPLVKVQFYIFFANWIKDFEIKFADGEKPGLEHLPDSPNCKPYKIKMISRV